MKEIYSIRASRHAGLDLVYSNGFTLMVVENRLFPFLSSNPVTSISSKYHRRCLPVIPNFLILYPWRLSYLSSSAAPAQSSPRSLIRPHWLNLPRARGAELRDATALNLIHLIHMFFSSQSSTEKHLNSAFSL